MDSTSFTHLLATNHPLSPEELNELETLLVAPTAQFSALDARIAHLQATIAGLTAARTSLHAALAAHQALKAPLRRVPPEVLHEIFRHCLPAQHNPVMSPDEAPLLLTRVCRLWRAVAVSTPLLWSRVHIAVPAEQGGYYPADLESPRRIARQTALFLEAVDAWLDRARAVPLSVSLASSSSSIRGVGDPLLARLMHFSHRWKHISILGALLPFQHLASLSREHVPILESLHIYPEYNHAPPPPCDIYHAPQLRAIALPHFTAVPEASNLAQLTSLSISKHGHVNTRLTPKDALAALRRCPSLVSCRLDITRGLPADLPAAQRRDNTVALSRLENLVVGGGHAELAALFEHLELLALTSLECRGPERPAGNRTWPFLAFLARGGARALRGVRVCNLWITRGDIEKFIECAPSVARLSVRGEVSHEADLSFGDDVLALFVPGLNAPPPCPRLTALEVTSCMASDGALLDFIRARTVGAAAAGVEHMESVCVTLESRRGRDVMSELSSDILKRTQVRLVYNNEPKSLPKATLRAVPWLGISDLAGLQYDVHPSVITPVHNDITLPEHLII